MTHSMRGTLNFDPMDAFMGYVLDALCEHGSHAVCIFPPAAGVLVSFADCIAMKVVCLGLSLARLKFLKVEAKP